jgi:ketosteroid isomerase-like protein
MGRVIGERDPGRGGRTEQAMTEPSLHRLQLAQHFMAAIGRSDVDGAVGLLSPTATYRVQGVHSMSGTFSADEVVDHLLTLIRRTSGTFDATKFDDWLSGEHYAACVVQVTFHGEGRRFSGQVMFLLRFDVAHLIDRVTVYFEDAEAIARFFGDTAPAG